MSKTRLVFLLDTDKKKFDKICEIIFSNSFFQYSKTADGFILKEKNSNLLRTTYNATAIVSYDAKNVVIEAQNRGWGPIQKKHVEEIADTIQKLIERGVGAIRFEFTDGRNNDFIQLCRELDDYLNHIAGGVKNRIEYIQYNKLDDIHDVIVAYFMNTPIGCASFKKYSDECAEIKRVFVRAEYRGLGISHQLMELLEEYAKSKGYHRMILESGKPLTAAMSLYKKRGYKIIPNYEPYNNMPNSICMELKI